MSDTVIDIFKNIIQYEGDEILIFFDKDENIWFSGVHVAKLLGYKNTKKALRIHVKPKYKEQFRNIKKISKIIKQDIHPMTIFLTESGLYQFLATSKQEKAKKFQTWLYEIALPILHENAKKYLKENYDKKIKQKLQQKQNLIDQKDSMLKKEKAKNKILELNQKGIEHTKGGVVYIIRLKGGKFKKLGYTFDLKHRLEVYKTGFPDESDIEVLAEIETPDPIKLEYCMKQILNKEIYRKKKEFYECSLKKMMNAANLCRKLFEYHECGRCQNNIEVEQITDHIANEFNIDINDKHNLFAAISIEDSYHSDLAHNQDDYNSDDDCDSNDRDDRDDLEKINKIIGGEDDTELFKYKYSKYKYKYLNLRNELFT